MGMLTGPWFLRAQDDGGKAGRGHWHGAGAGGRDGRTTTKRTHARGHARRWHTVSGWRRGAPAPRLLLYSTRREERLDRLSLPEALCPDTLLALCVYFLGSAHILSDDEEEDVVPTVFRWEHGGRQVREIHASPFFPLQARQLHACME